MRTIQIPTSRLIKYIPSEPDGGVIPGKVVRCYCPMLLRLDSYSFRLQYFAVSEKGAEGFAICRLDEELESIPDSNELQQVPELNLPYLKDDGVHFLLFPDFKEAKWNGSVCCIPDPFDALGRHQISSFVKYGLSHIACCAPDCNIRLAVIKKDANLISEPVIESKEPLTFGPPCQHNVGWLIPWASKSKGINIAWLDDKEMDSFVQNAVPLPKI